MSNFAARRRPKNPIHSIDSAFAWSRRAIMALRSRQGRRALGILGVLGLVGSLAGQTGVPCPDSAGPPPVAVGVPSPASCDRPLPINLPTALQLAGARPLDIAVASERVRVAAAQLERARVLWLPTVYLGADYLRHDGQIHRLPATSSRPAAVA